MGAELLRTTDELLAKQTGIIGFKLLKKLQAVIELRQTG